MSFPRRGEIYWGPGKEKIRPLLIVSNNRGNQYSNTVVVIPGTTKKIDTVYPVEVIVRVKGLPKPTKFQADSIFTIYKNKLGEKIGRISADVMSIINNALTIELDIKRSVSFHS